jgi:hypothetical protein
LREKEINKVLENRLKYTEKEYQSLEGLQKGGQENAVVLVSREF